MGESAVIPASADILEVLAKKFPGNSFLKFAYLWENITFSLLIVLFLGALAFFACRKKGLLP